MRPLFAAQVADETSGKDAIEGENLRWEVEAVLSWHDEDARAAIATLLEDCRHLREQLAFAERAMSRGMTRGWRPSFERPAIDETSMGETGIDRPVPNRAILNQPIPDQR